MSFLLNIDFVIFVIIAFFFWRGWQTGILRAFINPSVSFISFIIGVAIYDVTKDIMRCIIIIVLGSLLSSLAINTIIYLGRRNISKTYKNYKFIGSRILGALLSVAWKGGIVIFVLLVIAAMPAEHLGLTKLKDNIICSKSYATSDPFISDNIPALKHMLTTISAVTAPEIAKQYLSEEEHKEFYENPKIEALMKDKDIAKQMKDKKYGKAINNNHLADIRKDKELTSKLTTISLKIYEAQFKEE